MRILLTGAQGQVGWELARALPTLGTLITCNRAQLDLTDLAGLRAAILEHRPEVLVNAAAYTAVDQAESEPQLAMRINAQAVRVMADSMHELGGVVLHFSTDYVFDGSARAPMDEAHPTAPLNQYGLSKLAGEAALRESGVTHLNFRTSWIYSARGKNFLLTVLRLATERPELRIVSDQLGAPTWCRHVANIAVQVLRTCLGTAEARVRLREEWSGTYHLSAQGVTSWHGFAGEILRLRNGGRMPDVPRLTPVTSAQYPVSATRPLYSVLNNAKLQRTFAVPAQDWIDQLRQCMAELPQ